MRNYIISESQLNKILSFINEQPEPRLIDDLRTITSTLQNQGYDSEEIVDSMIALRQNDPYIIYKLMKIDAGEDFLRSVERLSKVSKQ